MYSGWLKDEEDPVIKRISQRTEYLTGLTLSTAEELQVTSRGIFGPHLCIFLYMGCD